MLLRWLDKESEVDHKAADISPNPSTVWGCRSLYLRICRLQGVDISARRNLYEDGLGTLSVQMWVQLVRSVHAYKNYSSSTCKASTHPPLK